ncbi:cysteine hydrolase family protein [Spongorhabdus nitratireducens]
MTNRALLVIDIQNDYFPEGKWPLYNIATAASNARKVLDQCRRDGDLIIHIHHEFLTDPAPFFEPGTYGAEIHEQVAPDADEVVILKHQVNSFRDTSLKAILDDSGVQEITVVGAMGHMCIDAAVRAAADFGYTVSVVEDACASKDLELNGEVVKAADVHTAYMSALGFAYATVISTSDWIRQRTAA